MSWIIPKQILNLWLLENFLIENTIHVTQILCRIQKENFIKNSPWGSHRSFHYILLLCYASAPRAPMQWKFNLNFIYFDRISLHPLCSLSFKGLWYHAVLLKSQPSSRSLFLQITEIFRLVFEVFWRWYDNDMEEIIYACVANQERGTWTCQVQGSKFFHFQA